MTDSSRLLVTVAFKTPIPNVVYEITFVNVGDIYLATSPGAGRGTTAEAIVARVDWLQHRGPENAGHRKRVAELRRRDLGRPPVTYPQKWADRFRQYRDELNGDDVKACDRLNDFELRCLVANDDYDEHRGRWSYDPKIERRKAAARVLKAIRPLI